MKSAFIIQRPDKIFIHTDTPELTGKYWKQLLDIPGFRDVLVIQKVEAPSQVFGVEFYWNAHKADVLRYEEYSHKIFKKTLSSCDLFSTSITFIYLLFFQDC